MRNRLLLERDLKLDDAVVIAAEAEQAIKASTPSQEGSTASVNRVKDDRASKRQPADRNDHATNCYRCGSRNHLANDESCKARCARCNLCRKLTIFDKVRPVTPKFMPQSRGK